MTQPCQPHPGCPCDEKCTIILAQERKIENLNERLNAWEKAWRLMKRKAIYIWMRPRKGRSP